jgi:hypothetical protein
MFIENVRDLQMLAAVTHLVEGLSLETETKLIISVLVALRKIQEKTRISPVLIGL